jgi:hypothetical protein
MSGYDPNRRHDPYEYEEPPYGYPDPEDVRHRQAIIFGKISSAVWFILFVILALILLRVIMLMINANEANPFVNWVYNASDFFVRPFLGITNDPSINGAVFEVNSLIAMLIYVLIIYGILQLVKVVLDLTSPSEP